MPSPEPCDHARVVAKITVEYCLHHLAFCARAAVEHQESHEGLLCCHRVIANESWGPFDTIDDVQHDLMRIAADSLAELAQMVIDVT